jgi:hypothetical protein
MQYSISNLNAFMILITIGYTFVGLKRRPSWELREQASQRYRFRPFQLGLAPVSGTVEWFHECGAVGEARPWRLAVSYLGWSDWPLKEGSEPLIRQQAPLAG